MVRCDICYVCQVSQCSGAMDSQENSLDSNKDTNYSQLDTSKEYSNLCTTAELDQMIAAGDQSSVEYSNLQYSRELFEKGNDTTDNDA